MRAIVLILLGTAVLVLLSCSIDRSTDRERGAPGATRPETSAVSALKVGDPEIAPGECYRMRVIATFFIVDSVGMTISEYHVGDRVVVPSRWRGQEMIDGDVCRWDEIF